MTLAHVYQLLMTLSLGTIVAVLMQSVGIALFPRLRSSSLAYLGLWSLGFFLVFLATAASFAR
jgi:hypothetical protein